MKVNIPLPFGHKKNKFYLPHQHVRTSDFGRIDPVCICEMVPGDDFNAESKSFCRLAPLPVPTFADVTLETCAFYVPLRQLFADGREFFTDGQAWSAELNAYYKPTIPAALNSMFAYMFCHQPYSVLGSNTKFDFSLTNSSGVVEYRSFSATGRRVYSLLCSLGYQITFKGDDDTPLSLLPLLAYLHVVHEYYYPQLAYPSPNILFWLSQQSRFYDNVCTLWSNLPIKDRYREQTSNLLYRIFDEIGNIGDGFLDSDYFTCAWKYPASNPSNYNGNVSEQSRKVPVPAPDSKYYVGTNVGTDKLPLYTGWNNLTNAGLNLLKAVTNYVTRNAVAGNKMVDRFFARFGIKLPDLVLQRPVYLGKHVQQVTISDVTSTSSIPDGSTLGDYAGKGTSYGDGKFSYTSDEYGYFIVLQIIKPHTGIATGRKRHVVHLAFEDFYTPEYDCIGVQAIRKDEVFCRFKDENEAKESYTAGYAPNGVFGYSPRYSEYKFGNFTLSGDFVSGSYYDNMSSYHMFRDSFVGNPVLDRSFLLASNTEYNDFNRIFTYGGNEFDHFTLINEVNITAYRAMHQIGETLDLEDVHGDGREVTTTFGGKHL